MRTEVLISNDINIAKAAEIIKNGGVAAFPTETVYGLGANAFNVAAVEKIFIAKGRPSDNPLIVHVADFEGVLGVAQDIPETVEKLIRLLGPAPLTYVLKKKACVPDIVTAGLDTVAVRIPENTVALKLIKSAGVPIAAPSANSSGRPSPTAAAHVYDDLNGKIPLILDGGPCGIGVESTVADFTGEVPVILRPGGFSKERLEELLNKTVPIYKKQAGDIAEKVKSPGLKYKHYSPKSRIIAVPFNDDTPANLAKEYDIQVQKGEKTVIICLSGFIKPLGNRRTVSMGTDEGEAARSIFGIFRKYEKEFGVMVCHLLEDSGIGRAYNDRLLRAASAKEIPSIKKKN